MLLHGGPLFVLPLNHAQIDLHENRQSCGEQDPRSVASFSQTVPSRKEQALRSEALPLDHTVDDAVFQFPGQKKLRLPVCRLDRRLLYSLRLSRRH